MKNRFYTLVIFSILLLTTSSYFQFWVYQISNTTQSSGIYYYRVEVEGKFIETKQMILLK